MQREIKSKIMDGSKIAAQILTNLKNEIRMFHEKPKLSVVIVGDNPASLLYTKMKKKKGEETGFSVDIHKLPEEIDEKELIAKINEVGYSSNGVLVQLPLPTRFNQSKILGSIDPLKDVDGLSPLNLGELMLGNEIFVSATAKAIIRLLETYHINLEKKDIVIINNSILIGKPLTIMLTNRRAVVTLCHEYTKNLKEHTNHADILITGVGKPHYIKKDFVRTGVVIIDVGISSKGDKVMGDVAIDEVYEKCLYITPVPGGVGPVTVATLLENTLKAYKIQKNI